VPHERGCRYQVAVVRHFFALIHRQHKSVDGLLVDVSAPLVVKNQGLGRRKLDFTPILHPSQFSNRLVDIAFIEDAVSFPENEHRVLSFFNLLQQRRIVRLLQAQHRTLVGLTWSQRVLIEHQSFSRIK